MKLQGDQLIVVTATSWQPRAIECIRSWTDHATFDLALIVVENGRHRTEDPDLGRWRTTLTLTHQAYLGTVPAFARGVAAALTFNPTWIACLHDDVYLSGLGWDVALIEHGIRHPRCGLVGFGGALGLGEPDIYETPYNPMQLVRKDFVSNMEQAEAHGRRVLQPTRIACLDGFSQILRRPFAQTHGGRQASVNGQTNIFQFMAEIGVVHHAYDALLGGLARRAGWEAWMLPIACHHFGGQTAVADLDYHAWADAREACDGMGSGDAALWRKAHEVTYHELRDVLPFHV